MIIGINLNHDYSLCILQDGKLYLKEMERISRIKHHWNSTSYTLSILDNFSIKELKKIKAIYINSPKIKQIKKNHGDLSSKKRTYTYTGDYLDNYKNTIAKGKIKVLNIEIFTVWISHYYAHAASAFFYSPYKESDIFCLDGGGDFGYGAWLSGRNNNINLLEPFLHDEYALSYHFFAQRVFQKNKGFYESKLMAIASYGNKTLSNKNFFDSKGSLIINKKEQITIHDIAKFQSDFEENIINLIKERKHSKYLVCAGGTFLNISLNAKIANSGLYESMYVPPFPSDMGTAVGCVLIASIDFFNKLPTTIEMTPYLGDNIKVNINDLVNIIESFHDKVEIK